jgi:uncharacterized protein DUF5076
MTRELDIPPAALKDPASFELIRVWAADDAQHVTIIPNLTGGPSNFGALLADLARHGARLYSQKENISILEALEKTTSYMSRELKEQGRNITGSIGHDA